MKSFKEIVTSLLEPGTRLSALFYAVLGLIVAVLLLTIGFWKTLLIVLCCLVGAFIGGVKDKRAFIQRFLSVFSRNHSE